MTQLFAVVVATVPEYYEYKKEHPKARSRPVSMVPATTENLEPYYAAVLSLPTTEPDSGLSKPKIEKKRWKSLLSSPRVRDGMLADSARIVEWQVHIGRERFTN